MKVRVFDMKNGLKEYENIKTIRIVSKDYNLLISKYMSKRLNELGIPNKISTIMEMVIFNLAKNKENLGYMCYINNYDIKDC